MSPVVFDVDGGGDVPLGQKSNLHVRMLVMLMTLWLDCCLDVRKASFAVGLGHCKIVVAGMPPTDSVVVVEVLLQESIADF